MTTCCFACSKSGHISYHFPDMQCYIVKTLATSPRTVQTRSSHQEHNITITGHTSNHVMTTTVVTDPSPLTTDTAKEDGLTSQDHAASPTAAEAPASIRGMHPTPHPTTTVAHDTHQPNNALDDTHWGHTEPAHQ